MVQLSLRFLVKVHEPLVVVVVGFLVVTLASCSVAAAALSPQLEHLCAS